MLFKFGWFWYIAFDTYDKYFSGVNVQCMSQFSCVHNIIDSDSLDVISPKCVHNDTMTNTEYNISHEKH